MTERNKPEKLIGFDAGKDLILDPRSLRGLAHPLRLRLRAELVEHGPATATQLASRIGESSGATSYHLRQLATYGFVVDEPSLGQGRERYWRAAQRAIWYEGSWSSDLPERELGGEYMRAVAQLYAERLVRFANSVEAAPQSLGADWAEAGSMSDWLLDLTPEQARALTRQFHELCLPYRHESDRDVPGARKVVVQFQVMPTAEDNRRS